MKRTASSLIALAFALSAGSALAAGHVNNQTGEGVFPASVASAPAKSRDQVRAELADAVRGGQVIANNATGETVRSLDVAARAPGAVGKTRDEVRAELAEAVSNGELIANNSTGETFSQRYPDRYVHIGTGIDAS